MNERSHQRHYAFTPVTTSEEEEESAESGGRRRPLRQVVLALAVLAALVLFLHQHYTFIPTEEKNIDALLKQNVWKGDEIIALLDAPKCASAIRRAKQRQPPSVALCPLCTRGTFNARRVQYLKVAKAGSSTMVKLLTKMDQGFTALARHLCQGQPQDDFRFTLVRNPIDRVISSYKEVDIGPWTHSPNVTYRNEHSEPSRILQFLDDFFSGRMASFDGGMPHHLFSAAVTLDATRSMNRIPHLMGRLEYMPEFINALNKETSANLTVPKANYARDHGSIPEVNNVIFSLFEEDFVCFGYPFVHDASAVNIPSNKMQAYQQNYMKQSAATTNCTARYFLEPSA